jgi:hypothetical protein
VSNSFTPVIAGSALGNSVAAPVSPKNIPNRGGEMNPSVDALDVSSRMPSVALTSCGVRPR